MSKITLRMNSFYTNILWIIALLGFIVGASVYHYGLLLQYPLNAEDLMTVEAMYSSLHYGAKYNNFDFIYIICALAATVLGNMTEFAARLHFTFLYSINMCFVLYFSLSEKGKKKGAFLLPVVALFSVVLFPALLNPQIFQDSGGGSLIYLWPFIYHYSARIWAFICLLVVSRFLSCTGKYRIFWFIMCMASVLYAVWQRDLIWWVVFLIPVMIVTVLRILYKPEWQKYVCGVFVFAFGLLLVSRVLPFDAIPGGWTRERAVVYGAVRGGTNWSSIDMLGEHFRNYIELNYILFDIHLDGSPVISLYTVVDIVRLCMLLVGYIFVFHIIKCSIWRKDRIQYGFVDEVLAWAYLLLSLIFLFTDYGASPFMRYFAGMTSIMTVLLCRNLFRFPEVMKLEILKTVSYKWVGICMAVCCVCSAGNVWSYQAPDDWGADLKEIREYIDWTDYGHVLSTYWVASRLSALGDGTKRAYHSPEEVKSEHGENAKCAYIVTENLNHLGRYNPFTVYSYCDTLDSILEHYSGMTDILYIGNFTVLVFENGL